jgi:Flp pilus assembly protein TadG
MSHSLRSRRDDRGVVALEFVIAAPFLLILILGAVALGTFISVRAQAAGLLREGARAAALRQTMPAGTETVPAGATCPTPTDTTAFITVKVTKSVPMSQIPLTPIVLDDDGVITETVTVRCGV